VINSTKSLTAVCFHVTFGHGFVFTVSSGVK